MIKIVGLPLTRKDSLTKAEIRDWEKSFVEAQEDLDAALNDGFEKFDAQRVDLGVQTVVLYVLHKKDETDHE